MCSNEQDTTKAKCEPLVSRVSEAQLWISVIHWQAGELGRLLSLLESSVEDELVRRYTEAQEFQNTPGDADPSLSLVLELEAKMDAVYTAAVHYRFWAYGGYLVTVLSWLNDQLLWLSDIQTHPSYVISLERRGECVQPQREPSLSCLVSKLSPNNSELSDRIVAWIDLRNRFVHSLGIVITQAERDRLSAALNVRFGSDGRMDLSAGLCRAVLTDAENCAIEAIESLTS